jgi:DNA-binding response OmpR family regulator
VPGRRIAIIDDDPDAVTFLSTFLEDEGYATVSAYDGETGIGMLRRERPDLLLLDLQMPGSSGTRLYCEVQKDADLRSLPVVIVTGLGEFDLYADDCRPAPRPAALVQKPIDRQELLALLGRILGPPT